MNIPYIKAEGVGNDFLLTWAREAPESGLAEVARAICDRHRGVGGDGWYLVSSAGEIDRRHGCDAGIHLYNSDGSEAELSGNGTRCVAAMLVHSGLAGEKVRILTGAGPRELRLLERGTNSFVFEMAMGTPVIRDEDLRRSLALAAGPQEVTILDVGNPQCAVFVNEFPDDWLRTAAELEGHAHFPNRSNVSFVRPVDRHTIEAQFYERGAGETLSSGTGSMGAAVSAIARGVVESPVEVRTPAGPMNLRWGGEVFLTGPASIVSKGEFYR